MKISVDDMFSKDACKKNLARHAEIRLNGVQVKFVLEANEEEGYIIRHNESMTERIKEFGKVEIIDHAPKLKIEAYNPWHPISDPVDLKHLGKLAEEAGELVSACNRCIIQGVDEAEPFTKKINRQWLQDEIADVLANAQLVIDRFDLNEDEITARVVTKAQRLREWHEMA